MKKILITLSAVFIATAAFSQTKQQVVLEKKEVQDPKKVPVRKAKIQPKESVKKAEPVKKETSRKEVVASPPREEKKNK
jgi:hypothetical protein